MSNRTVPAAAEGLPDYKSAFIGLETPMDTAQRFAQLVAHLVSEMIDRAEEEGGSRFYRLDEREGDLLVFAAFQAEEAANALERVWNDGHQASCRIEREAGR